MLISCLSSVSHQTSAIYNNLSLKILEANVAHFVHEILI